MSNLLVHARTELQHLFDSNEESDRSIANDVLELVAKFAGQHHSGTSAYACLDLFNRLARYRTISPLTGEPEEWVDAGNGTSQNRRCPSVFRDHKGRARDIDAVVFEDPSGARFTCNESMEMGEITFPYLPPIEPRIVKVDQEGKVVWPAS